MASTRQQVINAINKAYPTINAVKREEFDGTPKGIWIRGTENGITAKDGFDLFDYYSEDYQEKRYVFGVHKEIGDLVENMGWYFEWHDAGTIMVWES